MPPESVRSDSDGERRSHESREAPSLRGSHLSARRREARPRSAWEAQARDRQAAGGHREIWGPQELLIGSLASCFELTALAIARRRGVPIQAIRTDATGHVQSKDGSSRFVVFDLDVDIETDEGCEAAAESVASHAREESLVARSIGVPIRLTVEARTAERELATA